MGWAVTVAVADPLQAADQFQNIYKAFIQYDALQIEINPLAETPDRRGEWTGDFHLVVPVEVLNWGGMTRCGGAVVICDAKLGFDDSARFRQQRVFDLADDSETDAREVAAAKHDLNYIGLDGNIGCLGTEWISIVSRLVPVPRKLA